MKSSSALRPVLALCAALALGSLSGCNGPDATQAEFDQVRMFMSYKDVVSLFGSEPDKTTDIGLGAKACTWNNEDQTMAVLIFEGDQVRDFEFVDPSKILDKLNSGSR